MFDSVISPDPALGDAGLIVNSAEIRVGILHSLSGTMAISSTPLVEAALMAIAEINHAGGVLGQQVRPIIADGASDPKIYAQRANQLIQHDQVATIFGCWTSLSRKAVKSVVEANNALLWYPIQYEGLECSPNIFYTGTCANQQIEPAVTWLLQQQRRRFFLLGSDYVFPRTVNKLIAGQLQEQGGQVGGIAHVPLGEQDFTPVLEQIRHAQPDVIFNTLNGDSNLGFFQQFRAAGWSARELPIMSVSLTETELQFIGEAAIGHYASWSHFQSLNTPENQRFIEHFQARYGRNRVTSDPLATAYAQVYLWKQAVEQAQSFAVDPVRRAACGQTFLAPGGLLTIAANQHVWKPCRIGQIVAGGQFQILFESGQPIQPLPWLGVETLNLKHTATILQLLSEVSQGIQTNWQLEQQSRALETALHQLQLQTQERQRTEVALRESEVRYRSIFEGSVEGIFQTTLEGRYLSANPALARIYGYESPETLIAAIKDVTQQIYVDPNQRAEFQRLIAVTGTISGFESQVYRRDGSTIWISEHARLVRDSQGNPLFYEGTIQDISQRKQAEVALAAANQEITLLNQRLQAENLRMSTELDVTRHLQQMVLPRETELTAIAGLDIASFMEPAVEVGGDYYDVLQHQGKIKIGIGDVTGHGLESGLMMLMVQTAVRTLVAMDETDLATYLQGINQVLHANTQRMHSQKQMTLTLLEYERVDEALGRLRLSGQHEDVIIVRQNGAIEQIDTFELGFPLGIEADISPFIQQQELELRSGELVVLYTDGIPEATNLDNQQYGLRRLCAVLQGNCRRSSKEICEAVIDDLKQYIGAQRVEDDITLLIIKQQ